MASMASAHLAACAAPLSLSARSLSSKASHSELCCRLPVTRRAGRNALICMSSSPSEKSAYSSAEQRESSVEWQDFGRGLIAVAATASFIFGNAQGLMAEEEFQVYYGTAASASSYGGYGGNASKKDSAEYIYDVPALWKERNISKVEKGTNGTDSEWFNPKKRTEKVYVTFLAGFRRLPPQDTVLSNIALSDVNLQDQIAAAETVEQSTRTEDGQLYYDYEVDSPIGHSLISVTCTNNKLYAHFVNAPPPDWNRDQVMLKHIHDSFKTVVTGAQSS